MKMSYKYETQKTNLFTDEGQRLFLQVRDKVQKLLKASGAVRMEEAITGFGGSSWDLLACMDRMVELKELREIIQPYAPVSPYRIFVVAYYRGD